MFPIRAGRNRCYSVKRILADLKLAEIPTILALNKIDLVERDLLNGIERHARQLDAGEPVAISALNPKTLQSLLDKAGSLLARNLMAHPKGDRLS